MKFFATKTAHNLLALFLIWSVFGCKEKHDIHQFQVFIDHSNELKIEDILNKDLSFEQYFAQKTFPLGSYALWQKIAYDPAWETPNGRNKDEPVYIEANYPNYDYVDLYLVIDKQVVMHKSSGDMLIFSQREIPNRNHIFKLEPFDQQKSTIYIRYKTKGSIPAKVSFWARNDFEAAQLTEYMVFAGLAGILLVMLFYNLMLYLVIRSKSYIFYCFHNFSLLISILTMTGLFNQFVMPNHPLIGDRLPPYAMLCTAIAVLGFTYSYLEISKTRLRKFFYVLAAIALSSLFSYPFISYTAGLKISILIFLSYSIILFATALYRVRNGLTYAKFYLLSFIMLLTAGVLKGLTILGILSNELLGNWVVFIGAVAETILLSFGLAERINAMRKEKESAQSELIYVQKEQYRILEEKFAAKTEEFLAEREKRLKESKSTALAVLAAGVAHEINNPLAIVNLVAQRFEMMVRNQEDPRLLKLADKGLLSAERIRKITASLLLLTSQEDVDERTHIVEISAHIHNLLTSRLSKGNFNLNFKNSDNFDLLVNKANLITIIYSLVLNAMEAYEHANSKKEIIVAYEVDASTLTITVQDWGCGIPEEEKEKIFDPFYTTKPIGSMGMGLYESMSLAKKNDWVLELTQLANPTEFKLIVPTQIS